MWCLAPAVAAFRRDSSPVHRPCPVPACMSVRALPEIGSVVTGAYLYIHAASPTIDLNNPTDNDTEQTRSPAPGRFSRPVNQLPAQPCTAVPQSHPQHREWTRSTGQKARNVTLAPHVPRFISPGPSRDLTRQSHEAHKAANYDNTNYQVPYELRIGLAPAHRDRDDIRAGANWGRAKFTGQVEEKIQFAAAALGTQKSYWLAAPAIPKMWEN